MLYQMQNTLGLYLYTCSRVFKNREETIILFNLSTPKLKVPTNSIVHWTNVKPTSLMALISILQRQVKPNQYCHSLHSLVPLSVHSVKGKKLNTFGSLNMLCFIAFGRRTTVHSADVLTLPGASNFPFHWGAAVATLGSRLASQWRLLVVWTYGFRIVKLTASETWWSCPWISWCRRGWWSVGSWWRTC